jgi:uncharacterized protein (TIGR02145 family)
MKRLFTLLMVFVFTIGAFSQAPEKMSYQAVVRNASGELIKSSSVGIQISILQGSETGTAVYVETQTKTTNSNGLVTLEIGSGAPVTGTFAGIDWSFGSYFIKTETDPIGGTGYTITGTSQLLSVPYALYAETAGNVDALQSQINMLKNSLAGEGIVKDYENNVYNSMKIGTQTWMAENLKTTKYNDGTAIPNITDNTAWTALTTPAYCWYSNDATANKNKYGALYNWYTVITGKLCPTGWHVPSDAEWTTLTDYLTNNGYGYEGSGPDIAKSMAATWGWPAFSEECTIGNDQSSNNSSGFTALPGGYRDGGGGSGTFHAIGGFDKWCWGYWRSVTEYNDSTALTRALGDGNCGIYRDHGHKRGGFSVRCIKDN